jgi:hypothetical protein
MLRPNLDAQRRASVAPSITPSASILFGSVDLGGENIKVEKIEKHTFYEKLMYNLDVLVYLKSQLEASSRR